MSMAPNVNVDQTPAFAVVHTFVDEFLPTFAIAAGLMALIWLACAVVAICGAYLGSLAILSARHLIVACHRLRHRRNVEYAQLVTMHPDGVTTKVVNLDRYRRRRRQHPNLPGGHTRETDPKSDGSA